jgi:hypothetical protein
VQLANGGFEDYKGNKLNRFDFHDQPGEVSFVDTHHSWVWAAWHLHKA